MLTSTEGARKTKKMSEKKSKKTPSDTYKTKKMR